MLYAYTASQPGDLTIAKEEILTIVEERPNWWKARNARGNEGFVPSNYLGVIGQGWESEPCVSRGRR